jgi:hypothetical protein
LPCLGLTLGLLLLAASEANADLSVSNIGLYDGGSAPTAYISFTGSGGSIDVYADPQSSSATNFAGIPLYCIDLTHENHLGDTYNVNPFNPTFASTSTYSNPANLVAWAMENAGPTADDRGATQLFIWKIIGPGFTVNSFGDSGLSTAYNNLLSLTGYNPNLNYVPGATFLGVDRSLYTSTPSYYQDLAYASGGGNFTPQAIVPEPSTLVIAGLGALGLIGYGLCRRGRSSV